MNSSPEDFRNVMRQWTTGVCVVCSQHDNVVHGMTVNSFTSVSLDPPVISVTLANNTRTFNLVQKSGKFSISFLNVNQKELADRFSGKISEVGDRFYGLDVFRLPGGLIAIKHALAWLECSIKINVPIEKSTHFIADVDFAIVGEAGNPLIYHNREYVSL